MNLIQPIFIVLLTAAASTAFADWTKVATSYQSTNYADLDSIQSSGDIVSMDVLLDYSKVPFDGNNLPYLSVKMRSAYNCATEQFRTLKIASYSGHMATGEQPYASDEPTEWKPVLLRHTQDVFWETACRKKLRARPQR